MTTIPIHPAILIMSALCLLTAVFAIGVAIGKDIGSVQAAKEILILSKLEFDKFLHEVEEDKAVRRISHGEMVQMAEESKAKQKEQTQDNTERKSS